MSPPRRELREPAKIITTRIPADLLEDTTILAHRNNVSHAELVRDALYVFLDMVRDIETRIQLHLDYRGKLECLPSGPVRASLEAQAREYEQ